MRPVFMLVLGSMGCVGDPSATEAPAPTGLRQARDEGCVRPADFYVENNDTTNINYVLLLGPSDDHPF